MGAIKSLVVQVFRPNTSKSRMPGVLYCDIFLRLVSCKQAPSLPLRTRIPQAEAFQIWHKLSLRVSQGSHMPGRVICIQADCSSGAVAANVKAHSKAACSDAETAALSRLRVPG